MEKADYIFTHVITDDEDFLQKTIGLSEEIKETLFRYGSCRDGVMLMKRLQYIYTKNEIIELFESIDLNTIERGLAQYSIKIFRSLDTTFVYHNLKKINNNFIELHSELIRLKLIEEKWIKDNHIDLSTRADNNIDYDPAYK